MSPTAGNACAGSKWWRIPRECGKRPIPMACLFINGRTTDAHSLGNSKARACPVESFFDETPLFTKSNKSIQDEQYQLCTHSNGGHAVSPTPTAGGRSEYWRDIPLTFCGLHWPCSDQGHVASARVPAPHQEHGLQSRQRQGSCRQARGDDLFVTLDPDGAVGGDLLVRLVNVLHGETPPDRPAADPVRRDAGRRQLRPAPAVWAAPQRAGRCTTSIVHPLEVLLDPQRHHPHRRLPQATNACSPSRRKAARPTRRHFSTS